MLDFERAMRRADMALGNDGNIGLPYWDWSEAEVNGEVLPGVVRASLMGEFPDDFFPGVAPSRPLEMWRTKGDQAIKQGLARSDVGGMAERCLHSVSHAKHASTAFNDGRIT